jgi:hypothetical protein
MMTVRERREESGRIRQRFGSRPGVWCVVGIMDLSVTADSLRLLTAGSRTRCRPDAQNLRAPHAFAGPPAADSQRVRHCSPSGCVCPNGSTGAMVRKQPAVTTILRFQCNSPNTATPFVAPTYT